jgi:hypothetical protein
MGRIGPRCTQVSGSFLAFKPGLCGIPWCGRRDLNPHHASPQEPKSCGSAFGYPSRLSMPRLSLMDRQRRRSLSSQPCRSAASLAHGDLSQSPVGIGSSMPMA